MIELLTCGLFSHSKDTRRENQDTILPPVFINDGLLMAVADGVGSYDGAQYASQSAIKELPDLVTKGNLQNMTDLFMSLKEGISSLSSENIKFSHAATTLTFCFIDDNGLHIGHVGDCRLYVKDGSRLKQVTKDHTQHQKLLDEKIYSKNELKFLPGKNTLTTAIANAIPLDFQQTFIPHEELLDEYDECCVYLMSDGAHAFWDKRPRFSVNTISNPASFAASLYKRIERNGPIDDHSLIAIRYRVL
ncbi:PP2C family protein-serine/threonine phosphatase [Klebsiella pneumoniae]|jgi:serine/threonine protein phosphatase PrpC|uniref:PP2C family protein-serine/threonine phosphatase n=1 Tax=Klebsiella pneumoniae complex TaxID=3390273 RepID=UPI000535FE45|nr:MULTISPECIES: protein phosphatase 2C domain-containing protein [Klebsiella]AIX68913.1 protein phosphatase [Klebsiella pneumoniae subsp. pneumoniae]EKU7547709.1 serine/threonine-protein phosphatase [Klebsiella pneumoniae]EKW6094392.1 serine/threonine-protein phosphatase [Klebsiella pneumoniae]EKZ9586600.1 serine/threonine-protein phosphatase [Klebsiella pneumoniae]MBT0599252.1 serine/threonine-protein phosphatase [Klebsiella quasipneumoniae]